MVYPAGRVTDPWDIVAYEAKMLFGLYDVLSDPAAKQENPLVANAIVESACLHARILIDILLSKDSGKGDDIRLDQLVPGLRSPSVDKLRAVYGDARTQGSPCWTLNKMIAHPTLKRGTSYDYTGVIQQLLPLIKAVFGEVQNHHRSISTKLHQPPGGIDPRFCAKTSS